MKLPGLKFKNVNLGNCIVQGGMGVGVSLATLAGAVAGEGGLGIISSAGLDEIVSKRDGKNVGTYEAVRIEIEKAKSLSGGRGAIGINAMVAIVRDYEDTIRAAIDAGADAIISGGGLPLGLSGIKNPGHTALIPIVSSARALELIIKRWERDGYRPDAVVLEGPLAGGHLGFKYEEINNPASELENLLSEVLEVAHKYGGIPVVAAGGVFTHEDIEKFLSMGARGVQIGTRFLATKESSATDAYKQAVISATEDDILVVSFPDRNPASPCGLPLRILTSSPACTAERMPCCSRGFLLRNGVCKAKDDNRYLCVCSALMSSAGYAPEEPPLYTVGQNAYRVDKIVPVEELMKELLGE
ncbi:MAG: nitronate monooxygenase [Candidatus Kaiserbacteria bacterium]|nr:nitronate monooxygenase [Candidatus Kaiserbacteria bacterium]